MIITAPSSSIEGWIGCQVRTDYNLRVANCVLCVGYDSHNPAYMRRLTTIPCFLYILLLFACESESHDGIPSRLQAEIEAMKENCSCQPWIKEYVWRGEQVFVKGNSGPACSWTPVFYDSSGGVFELPAGYSYDDFSRDSRFIREVWSCHVGQRGGEEGLSNQSPIVLPLPKYPLAYLQNL